MKIEVGKRYVRRDGFVTPPLRSPAPSFANPAVWAFFEDGERGKVRYRLGECAFASYIFDEGPRPLKEHPFDLVAEYEDSDEKVFTGGDTSYVPDTNVLGANFLRGTSSTFAAAEKVVVDGVTIKDRNGGVDDTLNARGNNYGEFHSQAAISQELSDAMVSTPKWSELSSGQREALQMIQHKIARILNGNPLYLDSWVDIVGYAELGKRETERLGGK